MERAIVSNEDILESYRRHGSVWVVGRELGMSGQTVHSRLVKMGANRPMNVFGDDDRALLKACYHEYADAGQLDQLARRMNRTKHFICRQARALGLTERNRAKPCFSVWKYKPYEELIPIWERFKRSELDLKSFCAGEAFDDLGFSRAMKAAFPDEWDHVIELKFDRSSTYAMGRRLEYQVRDDLERRGFNACRSHLSRSPADVVAFRVGTMLMVQCRTSGYCQTGEWNDLFDLAKSVGAVPLIARRKRRDRIGYSLLLGRKTGQRTREPARLFALDEIA